MCDDAEIIYPVCEHRRAPFSPLGPKPIPCIRTMFLNIYFWFVSCSHKLAIVIPIHASRAKSQMAQTHRIIKFHRKFNYPNRKTLLLVVINDSLRICFVSHPLLPVWWWCYFTDTIISISYHHMICGMRKANAPWLTEERERRCQPHLLDVA